MAIVAPPKRLTGFVVQLQLKQAELALGEQEFADVLDVDRSHWYRLRHGQVEPSIGFARHVTALWPGEFDRFLPELYRAWGLPGGAAANGA